jgi:hypothetical protein
MTTKSKTMKNAKEQTSKQGGVNKLYFTSDFLSFLDHTSAINHAKELNDKTIATMSQNEADAFLAGMTGGNQQDELETFLDELTGYN